MNNSDAIAAFVGGISVSATSPTVSPRLCFDAVDSTYDHPGQSTDLQKQQKPHMYWTFLCRAGGVTAALRHENARLRSWALAVALLDIDRCVAGH